MELKVEIEGAFELEYFLLSALAGERLKKKLWRVVRKWSFQLERLIKQDMPVDTGRARASWGHWKGQKFINPKGRSFNPDASEDDAVWEEDETTLTITQGTNVPYVPLLNEGHSEQAPAGFIDDHFVEVRENLMLDVEEIIEDWKAGY